MLFFCLLIALVTTVSNANEQKWSSYLYSGVPHYNSDFRSYTYFRFTMMSCIDGPLYYTNRSRVGFGNNGYFLKSCDSAKDRDAYMCLLSPYYAFTYPRNRKVWQRSWTVQGGHYRILEDNITIRRFGMEISGLMRIETSSDATESGRMIGKAYDTLFSPDLGIVAITAKDDKSGRVLFETQWLINGPGLGHDLNDHYCPAFQQGFQQGSQRE